ncbi:nucleoside triphosphate pyrophosphohydrolase [Candidatus Woesearchaeota archaeon]|jgi:predicted house-cleaning noncanonical NTP pyrophosphatase (MazG superfamily)|nr:nucleoside triphosphate pyrophosphohydrolase [Candidatus Woesearchaeota archaeon]MBT7403066.1 nucleoside triphosphate pyrophosphohydrolase [Candidatus Woesearchaeota archaeon]
MNYDKPKGSVIDYDKLVRDKVPEIIKTFDRIPFTHTAEDDEYIKKLKAKLLEEVNEFINTDEEKELADILEIIYAICESKGIELAELEVTRRQKAKEKGSFKQKLILEKVEY